MSRVIGKHHRLIYLDAEVLACMDILEKLPHTACALHAPTTTTTHVNANDSNKNRQRTRHMKPSSYNVIQKIESK